MLDKILEYSKAITAAVGAVIIVVQAAVSGDPISLTDLQGAITAVLAALTVLGVYSVPNKSAS